MRTPLILAVLILGGCSERPQPAKETVPAVPAFDASFWRNEPFQVRPHEKQWIVITPLVSRVTVALVYPTRDRKAVEQAASRIWNHYKQEPLLRHYRTGSHSLAVIVYSLPKLGEIGDVCNAKLEGETKLVSRGDKPTEQLSEMEPPPLEWTFSVEEAERISERIEK
jgi:hypothetical protein